MLKLGMLQCSNKGFDLLASLGKSNLLFTENKITKQLVFLIISSTPSQKNSAQISSHSFSLFSPFSIYLPYTCLTLC